MRYEQLFERDDVDIELVKSGNTVRIKLDDGRRIDEIPIEIAPWTDPFEKLVDRWENEDESEKTSFNRRLDKQLQKLEGVMRKLKRHQQTYPYDQNACLKVQEATQDLRQITEQLEDICEASIDE